jgi:hypothetical protein
MNVIDMRTSLRRSPSLNNEAARLFPVERRKAERRVINAEGVGTAAVKNRHRVWLTPGERALIEDLYLLGDEG